MSFMLLPTLLASSRCCSGRSPRLGRIWDDSRQGCLHVRQTCVGRVWPKSDTFFPISVNSAGGRSSLASFGKHWAAGRPSTWLGARYRRGSSQWSVRARCRRPHSQPGPDSSLGAPAEFGPHLAELQHYGQNLSNSKGGLTFAELGKVERGATDQPCFVQRSAKPPCPRYLQRYLQICYRAEIVRVSASVCLEWELARGEFRDVRSEYLVAVAALPRTCWRVSMNVQLAGKPVQMLPEMLQAAQVVKCARRASS